MFARSSSFNQPLGQWNVLGRDELKKDSMFLGKSEVEGISILYEK